MNSSVLFGKRKNGLIGRRSLLLYQFVKWVIKLTVVIIMGCPCYQLYTTFYPISFSRLNPYIDAVTEDHQWGFSCNRTATDRFSAFVRYWRKNESTV
jgi:hypothetical protein